MKISACIITFNEEANIAEALESLNFADEIIVVDSESNDCTREIAEKMGAKVFARKWPGFARQKQFAIEKAENDWIFSLDADERVSDKLKAEILQLKELPENELADGYKIPRLSYYLKRPIRHSGWYPDWQIRFFDRRKGKWKDVLVHESVEINGNVKKLKYDILHFSIENAAHHHRMIGERYAPLAAEQMLAKGFRTTPLRIFTAGFVTFFQTFFLKLGFLDGLAGFSIARFAAHHSFLKHLMVWEKQNRKN